MIKSLTCKEFVKKLAESLNRDDVQTVMYNDFLGNIAFSVTEGDVVSTYYAPDASEVALDEYVEFAGLLSNLISTQTIKSILGDQQ